MSLDVLALALEAASRVGEVDTADREVVRYSAAMLGLDEEIVVMWLLYRCADGNVRLAVHGIDRTDPYTLAMREATA